MSLSKHPHLTSLSRIHLEFQLGELISDDILSFKPLSVGLFDSQQVEYAGRLIF